MSTDKSIESRDSDEDGSTGAFPVPFGLDALKSDILDVLLMLARRAAFAFGTDDGNAVPKIATALVGVQAGYDVLDPEFDADDLGFTWDKAMHMGLARTLCALYDYAFLGVVDLAREDMADESEAAWISTLIRDLAGSEFASMWDANRPSHPVDGPEHLRASLHRCLLVCETAQARRVLEGHDDNFMDWDRPADGGLTLRQMALLSGMTEPSVRTLTNPKRRNALATISDGKNVSVEPATAKAWLQVKGRYVPIRRVNRAGQFDLERRKFVGVDDLALALTHRLQHIVDRDGQELVFHRLRAVRPRLPAIDAYDRPVLNLTHADTADRQCMHAIAAALDLPPELLGLRAAEALARERLAELDREIQQHLTAARSG